MREDLIQALEGHDWFYQRSDDFKKWTRGSKQRSRIHELVAQAKESGWGDEAEELYNKYKPDAL
jgi:hypothetical protein